MYKIWNKFIDEFCKANNVPIDFKLNRRFRRARYSCLRNGGIIFRGITPENKVIRYRSIYNAMAEQAKSKVQVYGVYAHGVVPIRSPGAFLELLFTIDYNCDCHNLCIPTDNPFIFSSWAFAVPRLNVVYSRLCVMKQILTATKSDKLSVCHIYDPSYYCADSINDMNEFIRNFLNVIKEVFTYDVCERIKTVFGLTEHQKTYLVCSSGSTFSIFSPYDQEYWGNSDGSFLTVQPDSVSLGKGNLISSEGESTKHETGYLCRLNGFMFYVKDWSNIVNGLLSISTGLVACRPN